MNIDNLSTKDYYSLINQINFYYKYKLPKDVIVALFFSVDLTATAFLAGATGFLTATTFFGLTLALLFTLAFALIETACAFVATTTFLAGAATALVLAALFAASFG